MDFAAALYKDEDDHVCIGNPPFGGPEVLPPGPVLSLVVVKPKFKQFTDQVDKMLTDAGAIQITDDASNKFAVALGGEAKKLAKAIDARRKEVTEEASAFVDSVNNFCKNFTEQLVSNPKKTNQKCIEAVLKKKILDYQSKIELDRRKQEEVARKASEALQKEINKEAEKAGVEAPHVPAPVMPKQETVTRTETGTSAYQAKRWVCTVTDTAAVPRQYCEPSKKLLDDAVKMGAREIPGCKIEEVPDVRFRT